MRRMNRRDLLKAATAASAVGAATLGAPQGAKALYDRFASGDVPWHWVAPLREGSYLGRGWSLSAMSRIQEGRVRVRLEHPTQGTATVDVHRRVGAPRGIAYTRELDLLLMNGAGGETPSDEGLGLTIMSLGRRIARNEKQGAVRTADIAWLERHDRRPSVDRAC